MVLFRRKAVLHVPQREFSDEDTLVWYIPETGEYFTDYEDYLTRMDFYKQKRFICQVTGRSGLTYFEALESEVVGSKEVDELFPDPLKEPVLRAIQFSTISRLDSLVDHLYGSFKKDFYPGEYAFASIDNERKEVIIREKAKFNAIQLDNGQIRPEYSRYRVEFVEFPGEEATIDDQQLSRDRKKFTKNILRTFIKNSVAREGWSGAPWLVKEKYANMYRINTTPPAHILNEIKSRQAASSPAPASVKGRSTPTIQENGTPEGTKPGRKRKSDFSIPPPKKIPYEDLERPARCNYKRPRLKFIQSYPEKVIPFLLESWTFLQFFQEPLLIDSIPFDDYLQCFRIPSTYNQDNVMIQEIHCCLLKQFIDAKSKTIKVVFPEQIEKSSNDEHSDEPTSREESLVTDKQQDESEVSEEPPPTNLAKELEDLAGGDWIVRLSNRSFRNGGWETILSGILYETSAIDSWKEPSEQILNHLVPLNSPVTTESIRQNYLSLAPELKVLGVAILIELLESSHFVRSYLEECTEECTKVRRERMEVHKENRAATETLSALMQERKTFFSDETDDASTTGAENDDEDEPPVSRRLRKRTREDAENALARSNPSFAKVLAKIKATEATVDRCHQSFKEFETRLRVMDRQRLRSIGRDRFFNCYWLFENNGIPTGEDREEDDDDGDDDNYQMGRLWIQGPIEEDVEILKNNYVEQVIPSDNENSNYLVERKAKEENGTHLEDAKQWGFIDTVQSFNELIQWLNHQGVRESKLKRELEHRKSRIKESFVNRRRYLGFENEGQEEEEEEGQEEQGDGTPRKKSKIKKDEAQEDTKPRIKINDDDDTMEGANGAETSSDDETVNEEEFTKDSAKEQSSTIKQELKEEPISSLSNGKVEAVNGDAGENGETTNSIHEDDELDNSKLSGDGIGPGGEDEAFDRVLGWTNTMALAKLGHSHFEEPAARRPQRKTVANSSSKAKETPPLPVVEKKSKPPEPKPSTPSGSERRTTRSGGGNANVTKTRNSKRKRSKSNEGTSTPSTSGVSTRRSTRQHK